MSPSALGVRFAQEGPPELFEIGDIGVIKVGHMRDHDRVAREIRASNLPNLGEWCTFDLAERGEVDLRPGRQLNTEGVASSG